MRTSRKLTHYLMAVFTVAMMSMAALAADPGTVYPETSEASDQKAGSLLVYNVYQSSPTNVAAKDTKINITNTNDSNPIIVHFFFVNTACSVADFKTELTANQTYSFLVSDFDPGETGYILALAENFRGVPIKFNYLIGDLYTKDVTSASDAYQANLGAVAFAAVWAGTAIQTINPTTKERLEGVVLPGSSPSDVTDTISFDGVEYNRQPGTVALSNIPSRASNDRTILILNSVRGSLLTGVTGVGALFGLLFDDAEQSQSFQISIGCQYFRTLSNDVPRTVPRFDTVIPAGRTGWMKIYSQSSLGLLGSMIVYNQQARINFEGGHNLHTLTLSTNANSLTVPIFPFSGN